MLFHIYAKQQRLHDEVWGIFCSEGQDRRIKRNSTVIEMSDFPHVAGHLNEEKHISQANQRHIPPSYCFSYISCTKPQDCRLQSNLQSHEEKMKSTVQILHAKGSNCKTKVLFHRTGFINHSVLSMRGFFGKSVRSES